MADTDSDGDGTPNCNDSCPNDPDKVAPGVCGCGVADTDTDGDGTADCNDACPEDPNKVAPGQCGCGVADTDNDGDGIANCNDNCINTSNPNQADADNDGMGNACDACPNDADGDGVCGNIDNCPAVANANQADLDQDGIGDACDGTLSVCSALDGMVAAIQASNISSGLKNALNSKLNNAKAKYQQGNNNAATNMLNAFINQVQAQSGNGIPVDFANTLIANAQAIINAINSGNSNCTGGQGRIENNDNSAASLDGYKSLELFPNPASTSITVVLQGLENQADVFVCNQLGKVVLQTLIPEGTFSRKIDLDDQHFPSGMYWVQVTDGNGLRLAKRFVVAK